MELYALSGVESEHKAIFAVFPGFDQVRNQPPVFIHPQQMVDNRLEPRSTDIYPAGDPHSGGGEHKCCQCGALRRAAAVRLVHSFIIPPLILFCKLF